MQYLTPFLIYSLAANPISEPSLVRAASVSVSSELPLTSDNITAGQLHFVQTPLHFGQYNCEAMSEPRPSWDSFGDFSFCFV